MTQGSLQTAFLTLSFMLFGFSASADGVKGIIAQDFAYQAETTPMRLPTAVAIGPADEVYVLDGVNDRVVAFHADGRLASLIVPDGDAALRQPVGLRVGADGRLWIADSGNGRIVVCDRQGAVEQTLVLPPLENKSRTDPTDVAVSADGSSVWIADNDGHRVLRYDAVAGTWRTVGGMGESLGQWQYPFQLCFNQKGEILVSDVINARVQLLSADGAPLRSIGTFGVELGQLFRPGGLASDDESNIWVADSVTGVIQIFRRNGAVVDVLRDEADDPLHFESPLGLAFDRQGALYVVESRANRVRKLVLSRTSRPPLPAPPRRGAATGQQARACTICHLDWTSPFSEGRDSALVARPVGTRDDPVVSRSEICLSCHDGTVADSRRRVWDEHGHRTGVTPPAGMSVPAHLPLAEGKLACRTCHSAHTGDVPQGDFRRAVAIRVPNPSSELCASCHADKTGGPRFGTHPTGGMPWAIPAALVEAGAKVGPNPRELTCQVCHTPHGAKFDQLLVMNTASNQLCLTCHEQMRPGMFRDREQAEHPQMAKLNAAQAAAVRELGTRQGPEGELVCLSCHKLHHGKGGRFLLADDLSEGQMCLRCHEDRRQMLGSPHDLRTNFPGERNRLGMTAADGGACSACHLFHRYAREMTPGVGDTAGQCLTCHREGACAENKRLGSINHPAVRCTECHDPHQVQFASFLRERTDDLCARCHSDKMALLGGPHDSTNQTPAWCTASDRAGDRCLACHRPHSDERHGSYRVAPAASQPGASGACIACHTDTAAGGALALLHPQSPNRLVAGSGLTLAARADGAQEIICATCHDPHGGPMSTGKLLRATSSVGGIEVCVRCHTDMTQIVVTAHSPEAMREHGLGSAACGPCHQVHGSPATVADRLLWPTALWHSEGTAGDQYCLACHRDGAAAHPPAIATHPDVPMFNFAATGAATLPLFNLAGTADAHGTIGCRTCHLPHGRPMPDLPISAKPTPEIRAERIQLRPFEAPNACTSCHSVDALRRFLYFHDPERRGGVTVSR
jgi:predicted CXXCH cytochrome family protein